jgi:nucleoid-associated protein YgaU
MGFFGHHKDDQEAKDKQQYEEAQRRLEEARQHQQERQVQPQPSPSSSPKTPDTFGLNLGQPGSLGGQQPVGGTEIPPAGGTALGAGAGAGTSLTGNGTHDGSRDGVTHGDFQLYTVKQGDTLTGIAHHFFGRASAFQEILEANRATLKDADHIRAGQVLRIPRRGQGQLA